MFIHLFMKTNYVGVLFMCKNTHTEISEYHRVKNKIIFCLYSVPY